MGFLVWLAFVAVLAVAGAVQAWRKGARARALAGVARQLGLAFGPVDLFNDGWLPFRLFGLGTRRTVDNVVYGTLDGVEVRAFDYRFEDADAGSLTLPVQFDVSEGRAFSCGVAGVAATCPSLIVERRGARQPIDDLVGGDVLPLELDEFNRRFRVRCEDQRFAVAFLEQRMMAALLTMPLETALAVHEDRLLLVARRLPANEVAVLLHATAAVAKAVPRVLPSL
ncbi:MAG: hypothetical protein ACXVQJ_01930 [Actinomycetota bacterium]